MERTGQMAALDEFCRTLHQLSDVVKKLARIEEEKGTAAAEKQHSALNPLMREEQPLVLSLRGLEKQRMEQAAALGWEGLNFRQILEAADAEQKEALSPLFAELQEHAGRLKQTRETADRMLKVRLRELELMTAEMAKKPDGKAPASFHDRYV